MINLIKDIGNVSFFFSAMSVFSFISFLGRVRDLPGIFVFFTFLHLIVLIFWLICLFSVLKNQSEEAEAPSWKTLLVGSIPAICCLLTLWIGNGLGYWVGG